MPRVRTFRRKIAIGVVALLPAAAMAAAGGSPAQAITGDPTNPATLPAVSSSMWQTNGEVWALTVKNGVLWAAGDFTSIRPAGAPAGTGEVSMQRVAAFNATGPNIGLPCSTTTPCPGIGAWKDPQVTAKVWAIHVTADGKRLLAGGDFTYVAGQKRSKLVEWDLTKPNTATQVNWNPNLSGGAVRAIADVGNTLFVGGAFTTVNGANQSQLAAFDLTTNAFKTGFTPALDGNVLALQPNPVNSNLVIGGSFRNVNGASAISVAQIDQATGDVNGPMASGIIPAPTATTRSDVKALTTDGKLIYIGAEGTGANVFDGTAAVNASDGSLSWRDNCLGATQALAVLPSQNALYVGSHSHNCSALPGRSGFPQLPYQTGAASWHHLIAEQAQPTAAANSGGQLLTWFPNTNSGPTNAAAPNELGPRALATDGTTLFVGGQFTTVNGIAQRGLTRFTPGPTGARPTAPVVTATSAIPGNATIRWTGSSDADDQYLSYQVTRDGAPIYSVSPTDSPWWKNSTFVYRDASAPAGSHTYTVTATDASNQSTSGSATVTTAPSATGGYRSAVLADKPSFYWRLDEASGTVAKDSSGNGANGTYVSNTYTYGRVGAIAGNAGVIAKPPNANASIAQTGGVKAAPTNFSLEIWFRGILPTGAPTNGGGRLIGWSSAATGKSANPDKTLYLTNAGQLVYGIFTTNACNTGNNYFVAGTCYAWSAQDYNDGGWHHAVVTQSSTNGIVLYVDGVAVNAQPGGTTPQSATGLWRVGGDSSVASFPRAPTNLGFTGDIDEVAVYPTVLTPAQVAAHYRAAE